MIIQYIIDFLVLVSPFILLMFLNRRNTPELDALLMGLFVLACFGSALLTLIKLIIR